MAYDQNLNKYVVSVHNLNNVVADNVTPRCSPKEHGERTLSRKDSSSSSSGSGVSPGSPGQEQEGQEEQE